MFFLHSIHRPSIFSNRYILNQTKMKTIQAITGITSIVCMILMQIVDYNLSQDLFCLVIICLPVFLYASHIVGMENQDRKEAGNE